MDSNVVVVLVGWICQPSRDSFSLSLSLSLSLTHTHTHTHLSVYNFFSPMLHVCLYRTCPMPWMPLLLDASWTYTCFAISGTSNLAVLSMVKASLRASTGWPRLSKRVKSDSPKTRPSPIQKRERKRQCRQYHHHQQQTINRCALALFL